MMNGSEKKETKFKNDKKDFVELVDHFISAPERLDILFEGTPQKIRIVSNGISYGPCPEPEDIVEQHITINAQGRIWYSSYRFGDGNKKYEKAEMRNYKIDKQLANNIINSVVSYFINNEVDMEVTDVGSWEMKITNTEGATFNFLGCLCSDYKTDGVDICKFIRNALEMDDLFLFDGYVIF